MTSRIAAFRLIPEPLPCSEIYTATATFPVAVTRRLRSGRPTRFTWQADLRARIVRQRHRNFPPGSNIRFRWILGCAGLAHGLIVPE